MNLGKHLRKHLITNKLTKKAVGVSKDKPVAFLVMIKYIFCCSKTMVKDMMKD